MVKSCVSGAFAFLAASAHASEGSEASEMLSLLQTQVYKHNASTMPGDYDDVDDAPNADWPGYNFHEFQQSLCTKYGEKFPLQERGAIQKCATKILPSTVAAFNKDLTAFGGCASGYPFTWSWQTRVSTGSRDGLGRVPSFTSGDGPATEAVAEQCRLAAEQDPRCAGANVYVVQKYFCTCIGGAIGIRPKDTGYYRFAGPHLTCALKSMKASENPLTINGQTDGAKGELWSIKVTSTLQGCSKGWWTSNGGGIIYDSGQLRNGYQAGEYQRLGNANDFRRPSDCAAEIQRLKDGGSSINSIDLQCKNAIGAVMFAAGSYTIMGKQSDCGCLLPGFEEVASEYKNTGPAEYGGNLASSKGAWICRLDGGDVTKGETYLPIPKKSGKYSADGPSAEKPNLSPEEKKQCKANRERLKAARKEKRDLKAKFKEIRDLFKDAKNNFATIKAEMENC